MTFFSSSSSPFPRTFVTTSSCPVILDTLSFLMYRKSIENHLHDPLLSRRSVLPFDHQTTLISFPFRNIWYLLPCSGKISTFSYTCAVHHSQHLPYQSDQIRGSIRTTIGTIMFWMLCSYIRPWKYKWRTSFSFVISWVWKITVERVKMFFCTDFLVNVSSSYDFALDWVTQTSGECVTFRFWIDGSYVYCSHEDQYLRHSSLKVIY